MPRPAGIATGFLPRTAYTLSCGWAKGGRSMTVWAERVFFLNALLNFLLLLGSARLAGAPAPLRRLLPAASLGGVYAVLALVPALGFLQTAGMKLVAAAVMLLLAFGAERRTLRLGLIFWALAAAFAGLVLLCTQVFRTGLLVVGGSAYYPVSFFGLLLVAAAVYLAARLVFPRLLQHGGGQIVPLTLRLGTCELPLRALRDSGNTLCDPITGEAALVVDAQTAAELLPQADLTPARLSAPAALLPELAQRYPALRFRLLPYRAVGTSAGLLLAVRCELVDAGGRARRALAAFSPTPVSDGGAYHALTGA